MTQTQQSTTVLPPEALLDHWQGHRRLTRKMIEAFPEDKLFTYSIGGMRPFSELVLEFLGMAVPGLHGVVTGEWQNAFALPHHQKKSKPNTKEELLGQWDENTEEMNKLWKHIPPERFMENDKAFGEWEGPVWFFIFYWIDNEIHHRGQAYVYLRSLGVEPPPFWTVPDCPNRIKTIKVLEHKDQQAPKLPGREEHEEILVVSKALCCPVLTALITTGRSETE